MSRIGLRATAHYLPERWMTAAEVGAASGIPEHVLAEKFGLRGKHIAAEDEHVSDLAVAAGERRQLCVRWANAEAHRADSSSSRAPSFPSGVTTRDCALLGSSGRQVCRDASSCSRPRCRAALPDESATAQDRPVTAASSASKASTSGPSGATQPERIARTSASSSCCVTSGEER